jgi:hypothetical protein
VIEGEGANVLDASRVEAPVEVGAFADMVAGAAAEAVLGADGIIVRGGLKLIPTSLQTWT